MKAIRKNILLNTALFTVLYSGAVLAQEAVPPQDIPLEQPASVAEAPAEALIPEVLILKHIEEELKEKYKKELYIPPSIQSLIYLPAQQSLLREARGGFNTQLPAGPRTTGNLPLTDTKMPLESGAPSVRSLSLGGIVFLNPDDWTIWLNKKRITAAKLPREAVDLRVYKDFIELRWFDTQTNQIFPIRLRPNQTFSLDAKTFVPG